MSDLQLVQELQRAAQNKRVSASLRALLREAAERIWNTGDDERTPLPCPKCGSTGTDCDC